MTNMQDPFDDLQDGNAGIDDAELVSDEELTDALRFAEVLDRMAVGGGVDLDPREDPTLAALTTVGRSRRQRPRGHLDARYASYRARRAVPAGPHSSAKRATRDAPQPAARRPRAFGIPFLRPQCAHALRQRGSGRRRGARVRGLMAGGNESPRPEPAQVRGRRPGPWRKPDPGPPRRRTGSNRADAEADPLPPVTLPSNEPSGVEVPTSSPRRSSRPVTPHR